jgi:hypothetical protein
VLAEPCGKASDLAGAHVDDAARAAAELAARRDLELGRDQLADRERRGDRLDEEAVGRGRQHDAVAGRPMLLDERARRGADARLDRRGDEAGAKRRPAGGRAAGERRRVEAGELLGRDRALRVALGDLAVCGTERGAIEDALVDQERAPEDVGVAREKRAVEVEEREARATAGATARAFRIERRVALLALGGGALPVGRSGQAARRCQARGRVNAWMP